MSGGKVNRQSVQYWATLGIWSALLLIWIFFFPELEKGLLHWFPDRPRIISRTPLYTLALQHLVIAGVSTGLAIVTAVSLGVLVRVSRNEELKSLVLTASAIGETIPSAAIIALAVPILGYGNTPCLLALYLYAILPIIRNTILGFEMTPDTILEAGIGMGMSRWQQLKLVDLPLAMPVIMAGIRMALIINISAATIGATVGAGGFGVPIIAGIRVYDSVMVLQGSIPVLLMALIADLGLRHPRFSITQIYPGGQS